MPPFNVVSDWSTDSNCSDSSSSSTWIYFIIIFCFSTDFSLWLIFWMPSADVWESLGPNAEYSGFKKLPLMNVPDIYKKLVSPLFYNLVSLLCFSIIKGLSLSSLGLLILVFLLNFAAFLSFGSDLFKYELLKSLNEDSSISPFI